MGTKTIGKFVYKHYVDRDALLDFANNHKDGQIGCNDIARFPTADVVEVRHGEWYRHDKKKHGDTCYYCSVCEKMALADCMIWELSDYCPHCGAKMDGEVEKKK